MSVLEASWGRLWGVLGASWRHLGRLGGVLQASWRRLGSVLARLGRIWTHRVPSLEHRSSKNQKSFDFRSRFDRFLFPTSTPETKKIIDFSLVFQCFLRKQPFEVESEVESVLGASWRRLGASWRVLGASWRVLARLGCVLGASWLAKPPPT